MNTTKFHQIVTKTGIVSLAALAVIGIIASFVALCQVDLDCFPELLEEIHLFIVLTLSILVGFCFPVSLLMTLTSIAKSLKRND